jgi:chorismate mutase
VALDDLRKEIDEIDARIVALIADRLRVAGEVGKNKEQGNSFNTSGIWLEKRALVRTM